MKIEWLINGLEEMIGDWNIQIKDIQSDLVKISNETQADQILEFMRLKTLVEASHQELKNHLETFNV